MSKSQAKRIAAQRTDDAPAQTDKGETPPPKPAALLTVKDETKFRGARQAWYTRLQEFNGKPVDDFLASCKESCPQLTKAGTAEDPRGWLRFFVRQGVATLS